MGIFLVDFQAQTWENNPNFDISVSVYKVYKDNVGLTC